MAEWTRVLRSGELDDVFPPSPNAELAGSAKKYPKRFFQKDKAEAIGDGMALQQGHLLVAVADAGSNIPLGAPPPTAFLTADRMWRPQERLFLEAAASSILKSHHFPVGYDPYGEITWNRRGPELWWAIQAPELGVPEGSQVYCLDLLEMTDLWPSWSAFEWAWRVYYSQVLCMNGDPLGNPGSQHWSAGFGLGYYLAEFELHRRFNISVVDAQRLNAASVKGGKGKAKWHEWALPEAQRLREEEPSIGRNKLAAKLRKLANAATLARLPKHDDGIMQAIKKWEDAGELPHSTVNPNKRV